MVEGDEGKDCRNKNDKDEKKSWLEWLLLYLGVPAALVGAVTALTDLSCYFRTCNEPCQMAVPAARNLVRETHAKPEHVVGRVEAINTLTRCGARVGVRSFAKAWLYDVNFSGWDLTGVTFDDAQMPGAVLRDAKLENASLANAALSGADFEGAKLKNTNIAAAKLHGVVGLTESQIRGACITSPGGRPAKNGDGTEWKYPHGLSKNLDQLARKLGECRR